MHGDLQNGERMRRRLVLPLFPLYRTKHFGVRFGTEQWGIFVDGHSPNLVRS